MSYPLLELYLIDTWSAVADLNLTGLTQSEAHLKKGTLDLRWDLDDVPNLGKDDAVALRVKQDSADAGTVIFSGKIATRQLSGSTVNYTADNVLAELARIQMVVAGETRFNLFRAADGSVITIGQQIAAALDYAAAQGIDITYNQTEIDALDLNMPATEVSDITVYEVIKRCLTYKSEIKVAVEYTAPGTADTLRLVDQADLSTLTYNAAEIEASTANALYDRQVEGVVLTYRWTDYDADGVSTVGSASDTHGAVSGGSVLRQNIVLAGDDASRMFPLTIKPQFNGSEGWIDVYHFWKWAFNNTRPELVEQYPWGDIYQSGDQYPIRGDTYSYSGGTHIMPAVEYNGLDSVTKTEIGGVYDLNCWADRVYIAHMTGNDSWYGNCHISPVPMDNPPSVYFHLPCYGVTPNAENSYGFITGDDVPAGLAEQLYNILSPLQYDGQVLRYEDLTTPTGICSILRRLNIAGSENDLETMAAIIQQCRMDHLSGRQTIKFGPASHLEPQDFIALCRANRSIGNLRIA
jgi:hypothetical protein